MPLWTEHLNNLATHSCRPARPCTNASYPSPLFVNELGEGTLPGDGSHTLWLRCNQGFFLNIPNMEEVAGSCVDGKASFPEISDENKALGIKGYGCVVTKDLDKVETISVIAGRMSLKVTNDFLDMMFSDDPAPDANADAAAAADDPAPDAGLEERVNEETGETETVDTAFESGDSNMDFSSAEMSADMES